MGAWYGKTDDEAALKALTYAADRGMTFWDTADIYGKCMCPVNTLRIAITEAYALWIAEEVIGRWFKETGRRADIFLATKFGSHEVNTPMTTGLVPISKPSYVKRALTRALSRLNTSYIDLFYQHRVDSAVPIEVVLETLRGPLEDGTIRWFGLSECSVAVLRRARAVPGIGKKVIACQMEFSPFELELEKSGFAKAAEEESVSVVAYSPLGRGMITGQ